MTKAEREQLDSLLALLRGLLRRGSAREALAVLDAVRAGRPPHDALGLIVQQLRRDMTRTPVSSPLAVVEDCPLHCEITAAECVRRQIKTEAQRPTHQHNGRPDARKGIAGDHPTCDTRTCECGAAVRQQIAPPPTTPTAAKSGRAWRAHHDAAGQRAASRRLAAVGLLDVVPTCDGVPPSDEET